NLPRQNNIVLNGTVTAFAFTISLISGILFGLAPAIHAAKANVNSLLKESARSLTANAGGRRLRTVLVMSQVALSLVLLIGAGLMIRTFENMRRVDLGFDPASVLTFRVEANPWEFGDSGKRWHFYQRALETVRSLFGVVAVGGTARLPLDRYDLSESY